MWIPVQIFNLNVMIIVPFFFSYLISLFLFLSPYCSPDIELVERRDAVFSQVMASFMTGFMAQLEAALAGDLNPLPEHNSDSEVMSNRWLLQLAACGVLAEYELIIDPTVVRLLASLQASVGLTSKSHYLQVSSLHKPLSLSLALPLYFDSHRSQSYSLN